MNKHLIKLAHIVAVGIFLLVGVMVAAQENQNTNQNSNQQNSNRQSRNANRSSNKNRGAETDANANAGAGMNANANRGGMNAGGLSAADQKFVMEAAMGGMMEVELGRVATQQGTSDAVKQFGQRMVDDHTQANNELMQWASSKGMTLPTALDAKHQADLAKMQKLSGAAFDRAYSKAMVKDHEKDTALFQKESTRANDADLKAFAAKTLPTLQGHLTMARALNGGGSGASGNMSGNMNGSMGGGNMNGNSNANTNRRNSNRGNTNGGNANNSNRS